MIKVSIIVPVYNVEIYLRECMESIVNQSLREIEIVCVNDGSTDGSLDILKEYQKKDERIKVIDQENAGYGKAMNVGISHAVGEYIGIVEPDDFVELNMYEVLYKKAKSKDLDFIKADFHRFTTLEDGTRELKYNHLSPDSSKYNRVFSPNQEPLAMKFIMNTWSGIYKREFLEKYEIKHHETPGASFQDNGFWFQTFVYASRAMIIDQPFYMNRRDNPNSSVHSKEKVYCINQEYDYIRELMEKDPKNWERFRPMYWFKKYHNYMGTIWRIDESYRKEYVLRFGHEFARAMKLGELEKEVFTEYGWETLNMLIEDTEKFYHYRVLPASIDEQFWKDIEQLYIQNTKLRHEIQKVRSSKSFKIGKGIMSIPIEMKKRIKGKK